MVNGLEIFGAESSTNSSLAVGRTSQSVILRAKEQEAAKLKEFLERRQLRYRGIAGPAGSVTYKVTSSGVPLDELVGQFSNARFVTGTGSLTPLAFTRRYGTIRTSQQIEERSRGFTKESEPTQAEQSVGASLLPEIRKQAPAQARQTITQRFQNSERLREAGQRVASGDFLLESREQPSRTLVEASIDTEGQNNAVPLLVGEENQRGQFSREFLISEQRAPTPREQAVGASLLPIERDLPPQSFTSEEDTNRLILFGLSPTERSGLEADVLLEGPTETGLEFLFAGEQRREQILTERIAEKRSAGIETNPLLFITGEVGRGRIITSAPGLLLATTAGGAALGFGASLIPESVLGSTIFGSATVSTLLTGVGGAVGAGFILESGKRVSEELQAGNVPRAEAVVGETLIGTAGFGLGLSAGRRGAEIVGQRLVGLGRSETLIASGKYESPIFSMRSTRSTPLRESITPRDVPGLVENYAVKTQPVELRPDIVRFGKQKLIVRQNIFGRVTAYFVGGREYNVLREIKTGRIALVGKPATLGTKIRGKVFGQASNFDVKQNPIDVYGLQIDQQVLKGSAGRLLDIRRRTEFLLPRKATPRTQSSDRVKFQRPKGGGRTDILEALASGETKPTKPLVSIKPPRRTTGKSSGGAVSGALTTGFNVPSFGFDLEETVDISYGPSLQPTSRRGGILYDLNIGGVSLRTTVPTSLGRRQRTSQKQQPTTGESFKDTLRSVNSVILGRPISRRTLETVGFRQTSRNRRDEITGFDFSLALRTVFATAPLLEPPAQTTETPPGGFGIPLLGEDRRGRSRKRSGRIKTRKQKRRRPLAAGPLQATLTAANTSGNFTQPERTEKNLRSFSKRLSRGGAFFSGFETGEQQRGLKLSKFRLKL